MTRHQIQLSTVDEGEHGPEIQKWLTDSGIDIDQVLAYQVATYRADDGHLELTMFATCGGGRLFWDAVGVKDLDGYVKAEVAVPINAPSADQLQRWAKG